MAKHLVYIIAAIASLFMTSCGPDSHHFEIDGRFLKMNQGEFYVYSPDGLINGIDTIHVNGGRFGYEMMCETEGVIVIVLPNFSEIPVFVQPGKSVEMKADASHIKDIKITGTKNNEMMTEWRQSIDGMSPPDQQKQAELFIKDNPASIVSHWLLRKYFALQVKQDRNKMMELTEVINKGENATPSMSRLSNKIKRMNNLQVGDRLPNFTLTDIKGRTVSSSEYMKGKTVIVIWASWNYDGMNLQRMLRGTINAIKTKGGTAPNILSITLDPSDKITKKTMQRDSVSWHVVSDGQMWDSPLISTFGITTIPDNILLENGVVKARHMPMNDIIKELEK